ncbi:MAG: hypothetical protein R6V54_06670 [Desulfobacteraceae bacterium]
MKLTDCIPQKLSKAALGSILLVGALALIIAGLTVLPVIGFILAVPAAALGIYFIRLHLNKECQIDPS